MFSSIPGLYSLHTSSTSPLSWATAVPSSCRPLRCPGEAVASGHQVWKPQCSGQEWKCCASSFLYLIIWGIKHIVVPYIFQKSSRTIAQSPISSLSLLDLEYNLNKLGLPHRTTFSDRHHFVLLISFPSKDLVLDHTLSVILPTLPSQSQENRRWCSQVSGGCRAGKQVSWKQPSSWFFKLIFIGV